MSRRKKKSEPTHGGDVHLHRIERVEEWRHRAATEPISARVWWSGEAPGDRVDGSFDLQLARDIGGPLVGALLLWVWSRVRGLVKRLKLVMDDSASAAAVDKALSKIDERVAALEARDGPVGPAATPMGTTKQAEGDP